MAWTAPRTWVVGEIPTAANFNTHVRDNMLALDDRGHVQVHMSAAQDHTSSGSWQTINFDAETIDTNTYHDNVTNNSRLTIPSGMGGVYLVFASIAFASTSVTIGAKILLNGSDKFATLGIGSSTNGNAVYIGQLITVVAGDYLQVQGYQASGGNLAFSTGASSTASFFGAFRRPDG